MSVEENTSNYIGGSEQSTANLGLVHPESLRELKEAIENDFQAVQVN